MKTFIRFPKIGAFRQVIKAVQDKCEFTGLDENDEPIFDSSKPKPTLTFTGTVKLHGTNAGISFSKEDGIWAQSRTSIITTENDNFGFAFFVEKNKEVFEKLFNRLVCRDNEILTIFGEWIGKSIQKGVAISQLDKAFVIFAVKSTLINDDGEKGEVKWLDHTFLSSKENRIFNISEYENYTIEIDFNIPGEVQDRLLKITDKIEKECPFAKEFGVSGVGEGVVWTNHTSKFKTLRFKVKGEKHSAKDKNKKQRVAIEPEKLKSIQEFVDYAAHVPRFEQAIEKVFKTIENIDIKKMGEFIKWIINDIVEEEMDVMKESNLEPKEVNKFISNKARNWFLEIWNKI